MPVVKDTHKWKNFLNPIIAGIFAALGGFFVKLGSHYVNHIFEECGADIVHKSMGISASYWILITLFIVTGICFNIFFGKVSTSQSKG